MDTVLDFSLKQNSDQAMDLSSALASIIKPQPTFAPSLNLHDSLMASLLKYQLPSYTLPHYASSLITPQLGATANFTSNLPTALASALASINTSSTPNQLQTTITTSPSNGQPLAKRPKLETLLENDIIAPIPQNPVQLTTGLQSLTALPPPPPSPPQSTSSSSSNGRMSSQNSPIRNLVHTTSAKSTPVRKPPAPIPDEKKDASYYERRKKNNDAAKRSRDARRQKEEATATRAQYLEQENIQLHSQIALLKGEIAKLQMLLLTHGVHAANSNVMAQLQAKAEMHTDTNGTASDTASETTPKSVESHTQVD